MKHTASEYSRIRSIAQKRISRLESAGLKTGRTPALPKVKDISSSRDLEKAYNRVKNWLNTPEKSTVRGAREVQEKRKEARRVKQRDYYEREGKYRRKLSSGEKALLKTARGMGYGNKINAKNVKDFQSYLKYRRSLVGNQSAKYSSTRMIDQAFDEFAQIMDAEEKILARQDAMDGDSETDFFNKVMADMKAFISDQMDLSRNRDGMLGYSSADVSDLMRKFLKKGF